MKDFSLYFELGWKHILDWAGYDHILFVIALCAAYTLKDWRKILILITAFTLGHTITLALSTFDKITVPSALIEFLIPATITFTALSNIYRGSKKPTKPYFNYSLALLFGLIHGLAFSNYLKSLLGKSSNILYQLSAFNLGLEFGQLLIVFAILFISFLILLFARSSYKRWGFFLSSAIFGISFIMMIERFTILTTN